MFLNYLALLREIQWYDFLDIGLAAILIWLAIHPWRTARIRKAGMGLLLLGCIFLFAFKMNLGLTVWFIKVLAAVIILVVIVAYHGELRRMLDRFPRSLFAGMKTHVESLVAIEDVLIDVLTTLSRDKRGALIVIPGKDPLDGLITPGVPLGGQLSKALLLSIFDPNSPGHDGALVIVDESVERFGARLPLSDQEDQLRERGTRHAAALGLAEKTDAAVFVVSEETGHISLAQNGRLQLLAETGQIREAIDRFLVKTLGADVKSGFWGRKYLPKAAEGMLALLVSVLFWLVLVPGSVIETATYEIAVEVQNIPLNYTIESVTPSKVAVTLTGERRNLFKIKPEELIIRLDGTLTRFGRKTFPITSSLILLPPNIEIADLTPEQVIVKVTEFP